MDQDFNKQFLHLRKKKINKSTTLKWKKMQGNGKSSKKVLSIFRDQIKNLVNKNI